MKINRVHSLIGELQRVHLCPYRADEDISTIDSVITNAMKSHGEFNVNGSRIETADDLARLFKIFRDRRYETFRIIYIRDNQIVGTDYVTSRVPEYVDFGNGKEQIKRLHTYEEKMYRLKADGYYLFHNHPSGNATPSNNDRAMTETIAKRVVGFLGHIIIGDDSYTLIAPNGVETNVALEGEMKFTSLRNIHTVNALLPVLEHYAFDENVSLIIYADRQKFITAIQEADNYELQNPQISRYIRNRSRENGASYRYIVTKDRDLWFSKKDMLEHGVFTDIIYFNGDSVYSRVLHKAIKNESIT